MQSEFFRKKSNIEKGIPMIPWNKLCMPKSAGGLGLWKAEAINKAFQCKLAWKVLTGAPSLWVQSMMKKY